MSDEEYDDPTESKKSKNMNGVQKFKENKRNIHFEIMNSLKDLGPPNFLKTKFKISTILKCKNVEGLFFGSSSR